MDVSEFYEKTIIKDTKFYGRIINVREDEVELINGKLTYREVVEHPGGVVILAVNESGEAYMVRQYRYPVAEELLEAPAGKMEPGEKPEESAKRELMEETGLTAGKWVYFGPTYPSPGYSQETLHLFLALELKQGKACPDEDEFLRTVKINLNELTDMAMNGKIPDGKTINILFMAREYLKK